MRICRILTNNALVVLDEKGKEQIVCGKGIGYKIVQQLMEDARKLGVKTLFTLTYQPGFFAKSGFYEVPKEQLSQKVWKDCINCSKFPNCDEIAMVRPLE